MIKRLISNGIGFIRKNPTILYSIVLIIIVTGIIFFNSYFSLRKFETASDKLLQSKALLGGNVLKVFSSDKFSDKEYLEKKIFEIKNLDPEIRDIAILSKKEDGEGFSVLSSTGNVESFESNPTLYAILWSEEQAVAFLDHDENGRFWNVADIIRDSEGKKIGIAIFRLSLSSHDKFSEEIINSVYFVTIASLIFVLLIIINHARLFKYELKATKLEEIDKMKDDFISMASHELKSPLTAIKGYADLLKDEFSASRAGRKELDQYVSSLSKKDEELGHYIENIGVSASRLRDLVEDILEVSRLEQNRLPVNIEEISINEIVKEASAEMKVSADQKKLDFINNIEEELPKVRADKDRTKQIVVNLISNAIKYTPAGKIEIKGRVDENFVYITIADTGIGMSAEGMKNLFSKFYRIKTDKTVSVSGTGLGLWISREIALKMDGDITAESIEGVGSHFTLKLKIAKSKK